jgi:hypothetical protein
MVPEASDLKRSFSAAGDDTAQDVNSLAAGGASVKAWSHQSSEESSCGAELRGVRGELTSGREAYMAWRMSASLPLPPRVAILACSNLPRSLSQELSGGKTSLLTSSMATPHMKAVE